VNLAEYIVDHRAPNSEPKCIADILERLCWILDQKTSSEILDTLELWLSGEDRLRVAIALSLEEFYLKESPDQLATTYEEVCQRFPEFRSQCDATLSGWRAQIQETKNGEQAVSGNRR
jgi:hypothetical protein